MLPKDPSKIEEYRNKLRIASKRNPPSHNMPHTEEGKRNISLSLKGRISPMKGKHFSEEIRQRNRLGQKKYYASLPKIQCRELGCSEMTLATTLSGYCKIHRGKYQMRKYMEEHPEYVNRMRENTKIWNRNRRIMDRVGVAKKGRAFREKLKIEVFSHYSNGFPKCNKCGYIDIRALCLDHINNDGAEHRKKLTKNSYRGGNAIAIYLDVRRRNYPKGFQVLCHNCNRIKEYKRQRINMRKWDEKHASS